MFGIWSGKIGTKNLKENDISIPWNIGTMDYWMNGQ